MKQTENNSNEFDLTSPAKVAPTTPYLSVEKRQPKGYLNSFQMPNLTDKQIKAFKKSRERQSR